MVPWDRTILKSAEMLYATPYLQIAAGGRWVTCANYSSTSYELNSTQLGYGDSLYPYYFAANNSRTPLAGFISSAPAAAPTTAASVGTFASAIQGAIRVNTTADAASTAYLQIGRYTDTYSLTNVGNTTAIVRVWHIRRKKMYPLAGTYAGCTVASAGAPTYVPTTGDFEDQLEYAAIRHEYTDQAIYDPIATVPLPYITYSVGGTTVGAASGTTANAYACIWELPMTMLPSLRRTNSIKLFRTISIPVGGTKTIRYNYKKKTYSTVKLANDILESEVNSSNDRGERVGGLKIMFQVIGQNCVSNDNDYQTDRGTAGITIKNVRSIVHRVCVRPELPHTFLRNGIYAESSEGFNRFFTRGVPQIAYADGIPVGPISRTNVGHLPVDLYAQNAAGAWIPALSSASTAGAQVTAAT